MNFAGLFHGKNFLIIVDSFSKWLEVRLILSTTASVALRKMFSTHGILDIVVLDNGPQFASAEFCDFLKSNPIRQSCTAPYHPSGIGQTERMLTKDLLKHIKPENWKKMPSKFYAETTYNSFICYCICTILIVNEKNIEDVPRSYQSRPRC